MDHLATQATAGRRQSGHGKPSGRPQGRPTESFVDMDFASQLEVFERNQVAVVS
jgi:hypothetical protein